MRFNPPPGRHGNMDACPGCIIFLECLLTDCNRLRFSGIWQLSEEKRRINNAFLPIKWAWSSLQSAMTAEHPATLGLPAKEDDAGGFLLRSAGCSESPDASSYKRAARQTVYVSGTFLFVCRYIILPSPVSPVISLCGVV